MHPGVSRTIVQPSHAVIAPDNTTTAALPDWERSVGTVQVSPAMGAHFMQYCVAMEPGGISGPTRPWVERFVYGLEGEVFAELGEGVMNIHAGDYMYVPPEQAHKIQARASSRLLVFEHNYYTLAGVEPPEPHFGRASNAPAKPLMGDHDVFKQTLLPPTSHFDMAVNIYSLYPGSTLPRVTAKPSDRGILILDGDGIARIGDTWSPVTAGDAMWAKAHCPFWFAAVGKAPTRYLQFETTNREPIEP